MGRIAIPIAAIAIALVTDRAHVNLLARRAEFPPDADVLYLPGPRHLELMSLGYREALADFVWIRAVIFSGEHLGQDTIEWVDDYLDGIMALAPRLRRPYAWGGITSVYSGHKAITKSMVERALALYRRGLSQFPEDHEMLFTLGMLLTRDVQTIPGFSPEERLAAKSEGIELVRKAAAFGAPPVVRQYAATLLGDAATDQLAIQFLETQLLETDDEGYKRVLRRKLDELLGAELVRSLERLRSDFLAERDRKAPYVPETLFAVIRDE